MISIKLTTQLPNQDKPDLYFAGYYNKQVWHVRVIRDGKELKELHKIFTDIDEARRYMYYLDANIAELKVS